MVTLIIGCLAAGTAAAHVDETGAARIESGTLKLGTSNGYYQYWLSYHLRGSRHSRYATHFFRIEYANNNLGPWHVYRRLDKHHGQSYPMPLHRWYRVRAGGLPCFLDACTYSLTSQMHWIPAQPCGGATPLPE
jgi:hypothetical protein